MTEIGLRSDKIGPHSYRAGRYIVRMIRGRWWIFVGPDILADDISMDFRTLTNARAWCRANP